MNRILALALILALGAGSGAVAKSCRDASGKFTKCPPAAAAAAPAASSSASAAKVAPNCKKGKLCGGSCIAMSKVCHK